MATIEPIVRSIQRELTPQFEERLRAALADERVGRGMVVALALINNLEVNEQVLYARAGPSDRSPGPISREAMIRSLAVAGSAGATLRSREPISAAPGGPDRARRARQAAS